MTEVFVVGGARTPMTEYTGALKDVSALELGAIAARAAFAKTGVSVEAVRKAASVVSPLPPGSRPPPR